MRILSILLLLPSGLSYEEPSYFQRYEDLFGAKFLKRCKKRRNPPTPGDACQRVPKTGLWGSQMCNGVEEPTTQCTCRDSIWSCEEFNCPTPPSDKSNVNVCSLPMDVGPCDAATPRWAFNDATQECESFSYGGCGGNANNFLTQNECETSCKDGVCWPTLDPSGPPCAGLQVFPWHFNRVTKKCVEYAYGGCGAIENNFPTFSACDKSCCVGSGACHHDQCILPDVISCDEVVPRWYFDSATGTCVLYQDGACAGNANNFPTKAECEGSCRFFGQDRCGLPDIVSCDNVASGWHFDSATVTCFPYTDGSCAGNANNFPTNAECEESCISAIPRCSQPQVTGSCTDSLPRWSYDDAMGTCVPFKYSGCGGNKNNFESELQCDGFCGV